MATLGVGPPTVIGIKELGAQSLENQIMAVSVNDRISENAKALAEKLKSKKNRQNDQKKVTTLMAGEKEATDSDEEENSEGHGKVLNDPGDGVNNAVGLIREYLSSPFTKRPTFRKIMTWQKDDDVIACPTCSTAFTFFNRRHHCRSCGGVFCADCLKPEALINYTDPQLICDTCSLRKY